MFETKKKDELNKKIAANDVIMPTNNDYEGVIKAVHRLQTTYLLDVKDIQMGNLSEKYPTARPLKGL